MQVVGGQIVSYVLVAMSTFYICKIKFCIIDKYWRLFEKSLQKVASEILRSQIISNFSIDWDDSYNFFFLRYF